MSDPIILTRDKVQREWSDFEPKLVAALLSGAGTTVVAGIILPIAKNAGIVIAPEFITAIPLVIAGIIGWLTPSVGTTVTKKVQGNGTASETHSGNPVTTITQSTPIQAPMGKPASPESNSGGLAPVATNDQDSVTAILNGRDVTPEPDLNSGPTALYPRGAAILSQLPSTRTDAP